MPTLGVWVLVRRPLFIAFVLGCVASLLTSGMLTPRIVFPTAVYWMFVPLAQMLALAIVTWSRRDSRPFSFTSDTFFAGHTAWTTLLIVVAAALAFLPPEFGWEHIRTWLWAAIGVALWSAYVDVRFFRSIFGSSRAAAVRDVVICRLISWPIIFAIFAVPGTNPVGVVREVVDALKELLR